MHNDTLHIICIVLALVLFVLAGLSVTTGRASLGWWGLFFAALALFVF